jgi:hypothetical protein
MSLRFTFYTLRCASLILLGSVAFCVITIFSATPTRAMPEYATRVGEPCASCHFSPSGGGLRNVRGQAWVALEKPSSVPSTADALKMLGVQLPSDMSVYTNAPAMLPTPSPFKTRAQSYMSLVGRLLNYEGN